jgi:5-methylcytosine-specific restriction endonuclease McrA
MIRIRRGDEPDALRDVRATELPRVRALHAAKVPPARLTADEIGVRYQVAKKALWEAQHYKCAYCESQEQLKRNDAEHFRPKTEADRRPGVAADHGYWWLAWTWDNLLFACRNCNQYPAKHIQFPLDTGSVALAPEEQPPGRELPLLIDPETTSGIDHIQFEPAKPHGLWTPKARNGSDKGAHTIRVCKLDAPDRLTAYTSHVTIEVGRQRALIEAAIDGGDYGEVWEAWELALGSLLDPAQRFVGLSYDALDHFFPKHPVRDRWGLTLRKPD